MDSRNSARVARSKKWLGWLVMAAVAQTVGSCGDSSSGASGALQLQPAASKGRFVARISGERGTVADATVTIDGQVLGKSNGQGVFELELPTGRHHLKITASGYVDWEHDLPVVGEPVQHELSMASLPEPTIVTTNQPVTTLQVGQATLVFPMGAFTSDVPVTSVPVQAALIPGASNAHPGSYLFMDAGGETRVVLGALHIRSPMQPKTSVFVAFPVPPDVPPDSLRLFHLDAEGEAIEPTAPTQVADGAATFSVSHFSTLVLTKKAEAKIVAGIVDLVGVAETRTPPSTTWSTAKEGQVLAEGTEVRTVGNHTWARLTYGFGTEIRLGPNSSFVVTADPMGLAWVGFNVRREVVKWQRKLKKKFEVRQPLGGTCSIRGSIASWKSEPVATQSNLEEIDFQVYEGEGVCNLASGQEIIIPSGQKAVGQVPVGPESSSSPNSDAGAPLSCGTVPGCSEFCASMEKLALQQCAEKKGTVSSEFNYPNCLSACTCLSQSCPTALPCVANPSCPGCPPECINAVNGCPTWGGWLKCTIVR
ncbi:MAG: PEGA domain-containing protein [Polyangiaceae bacterium]